MTPPIFNYLPFYICTRICDEDRCIEFHPDVISSPRWAKLRSADLYFAHVNIIFAGAVMRDTISASKVSLFRITIHRRALNGH